MKIRSRALAIAKSFNASMEEINEEKDLEGLEPSYIWVRSAGYNKEMTSKREGKRTTDDDTYVPARLPNSSVSSCFQLFCYLLLLNKKGRRGDCKNKGTQLQRMEACSKLRHIKDLDSKTKHEQSTANRIRFCAVSSWVLITTDNLSPALLQAQSFQPSNCCINHPGSNCFCCFRPRLCSGAIKLCTALSTWRHAITLLLSCDQSLRHLVCICNSALF